MHMIPSARRDDLISLAYLLLFLLDDLTFVSLFDTGEPFNVVFRNIKRAKVQLKNTCATSSRLLDDFLKEIFSFGYDQEPFYGKLKHLLIKQLLEREQVPNKDAMSLIEID